MNITQLCKELRLSYIRENHDILAEEASKKLDKKVETAKKDSK